MKIRFSVPEAADPRREGGMQLPPQQARRVLARWRWLLIVLLALSPALYVAGVLVQGWLWIEASGYVVFEETSVTAPCAGTVRAVHVANGSTVTSRAPLLELEDAELNAELEALDARARLPARRAELAALDRQIVALQAQRAAQQGESSAIEGLRASGAATQGEVLAALARASAVEGELAALERERARQRDLASARGGPGAEQASRRAVLAARQRELRVEAPLGGTVDGLAVAAGHNVAAREPLLVIRHGDPRVVGFMQGRELAIRPGERVRITLPDGKTIPGDVVGQAPSTLRLPEELAGSFDQRTPRLQVMIAPVGLPPEARVHRLPVTVRLFRFRL